jgi:hypothetical protein
MLLLLVNCLQSKAQNLDQLKQVLPPSPNASNLSKYVDWPVSLYTGLPEINIPLTEVHGNRVSIPIALNYHASGIKVNEIASWVGLGFSLDAGGVITRTVNGLPDDNGGYLMLRKSYSNPGDLTSATVQYPILTDSLYWYKSAYGRADSEPDYYTFNALGKSYSFFFSGDGSIITQPQSNVKITYNDVSIGQELTQWKIVFEDGTQLFFGGSEAFNERITNSMYGDPENGAASVISGWYLNKVISSTNEVFLFTYKQEQIEHSVSLSQTRYKPTQSSFPIMNGSNNINKPLVTSKILKKIEGEVDSVVFVTSLRQDLQNGNKLDEIKCYSKVSGALVRRFQFSYNYSTATNSTTFDNTNTSYNYRLKLAQLKEVSNSASGSRVWKFEYNSNSLPSRASYAQDHWGYYNGAVSNNTLLPLDPYFDPIIDGYANRDADSTAVKAEMLTKITYPTGGYSAFDYQSNQYNVLQDNYRDTLVTVVGSNTYTFTTNKTQVVDLWIAGAFQNYQEFQGGLASLDIYNSSNVNVGYVKITRANLSGGSANVSNKVALTPGTYTVKISAVDASIVVALSGTIHCSKFVGNFISPKLVGGLRIKRIDDYDYSQTLVRRRSFSYAQPFEIHKIGNTDYSSITTVRDYTCDLDNYGITYNTYTYYTRYSNIKFPCGSIRGGAIGYGKVTTYEQTGANGKIVSYFTNDVDLHIPESTVLPYPNVTDRPWRRGLMYKQEFYSSAGELLKKQTHKYSFVNSKTITSFKSALKYIFTGPCLTFSFLSQIMVRSYFYINSEQVHEDLMSEVTYNKHPDNSIDSFSIVKNFFYDTPNGFVATRIETLDSKGKLSRISQRTPLEKSTILSVSSLSPSASAAIDSLIRRNRVEEILQVEEQLDGIVKKRTTTNYKRWPNSTIAPFEVVYQMGNNSPDTLIRFNKYDGKGNLLEQQKVKDIKHNYLYDYNNAYPIVEVINADSSNIAYTSFEANGLGNWTVNSTSRDFVNAYTGSKSLLLTTGITISKSSLNAGVTYRVAFWAKNGANIQVNGASATAIISRKGWTYFEKKISGITSVSLSGSGNIDEVRLCPVDAQMTTYTYAPLVGITSTTDNSGYSTFYSYDDMQRLVTVKDDDGRVVKTFTYNYKSTQ